MSRAPFNTTCDFVRGPTSVAGPPFAVYRTGVPCRVVPQARIVQLDYPQSYSVRWITYPGDAAVTNAVVSLGVAGGSVDQGRCDLVAVPSGNVPLWSAARGETISPYAGIQYRRAQLVPYPFPWGGSGSGSGSGGGGTITVRCCDGPVAAILYFTGDESIYGFSATDIPLAYDPVLSVWRSTLYPNPDSINIRFWVDCTLIGWRFYVSVVNDSGGYAPYYFSPTSCSPMDGTFVWAGSSNIHLYD